MTTIICDTCYILKTDFFSPSLYLITLSILLPIKYLKVVLIVSDHHRKQGNMHGLSTHRRQHFSVNIPNANTSLALEAM